MDVNQALSTKQQSIIPIAAFTANGDLSKLKTALQEGLIVFPVIAKACAWKTVDWLSKMNVRPKDGKAIWSDSSSHIDRNLAAIAEEVADSIGRKI